MHDSVKFYFYVYLLLGFMLILAVLINTNYHTIRDFLKFDEYFKIYKINIEYVLKNLVEFFASSFIAVLWPLYIFMQLYYFYDDLRSKKINKQRVSEFELKISDLFDKVDRFEIERREIVYDPLNAAPSIPFGHLNKAWIDFCENIDTQDQLWAFDVVWPSEPRMQRYAGYAAVRNNNIKFIFCTMFNFLD